MNSAPNIFEGIFPLASHFGYQSVMIGADGVLLSKNGRNFYIYSSRDLFTLSYFEAKSPDMIYSLSNLFFRKRSRDTDFKYCPAKPVWESDRIIGMHFVNRILISGRDIISNDELWKKEHGPPFRLLPEKDYNFTNEAVKASLKLKM